MLWPILSLLLLASVAPRLGRVAHGAAAWILGGAVLGVGGLFAAELPLHGARLEVWQWVPTLGLEMAFRLDGLAATFALLITGIGGLVIIHSGGYMKGHPELGRFLALLLFFIASMLGVVLCDNLVGLFVFWELTSVASYLLIGFDHEKKAARQAALKAVVITGAGGVALLVGLILLRMAGLQSGLDAESSWRLSALLELDLRGHFLYAPILVLVLAGAFTKSAQVPFHFWLPAAMAAPTPTSALLHSATMVKAGIYLLARLHPALGQTVLWEVALGTAGGLTMLTGAFIALGQKDMKRILAWSTVSVLGILTMLLGLGTEAAIKAMVVFLVAHALYKAALFLIAANVDHETGTRDVTVLGGLRRAMPFTATAGILAALSKAGAPPMFGFVGKELLYKAKLDLEAITGWAIIAAVLANILLVASALLVGFKPFFGRARETPRTPHEAPWSMRLGPLVLGGLGLFVAVYPDWFDRNLAGPMASAVAGYPVPMRLTLWHGVSPLALSALALSALTVGLGIAVFVRVGPRLHRTGAVAHALGRWGPSRAFEAGLERLYPAAGALTRRIQSGSLRHYLIIIALAAIAAVGIPALAALQEEGLPEFGTPTPWELAIAGVMVAGAIVAARASHRLTAVAALGATGTGMALLFLLFSAPDLAITQIMVETLIVVLLVLVFHRLPPSPPRSRPASRGRDLVVAGGVGATVTLAMLAAATLSAEPRVARWFAEASVPLAFGRNVVNVILVDFRALDTLGEVTVVAVAGIGVFALIGARATKAEARR